MLFWGLGLTGDAEGDKPFGLSVGLWPTAGVGNRRLSDAAPLPPLQVTRYSCVGAPLRRPYKMYTVCVGFSFYSTFTALIFDQADR